MKKSIPPLPLASLKVLDFAQFMAGPAAALRLADLGAEVIKIERPDGGDLCRSLVINDQMFEGDSLLFHTINRNKHSVTANLKDPVDLERIKQLVAEADVMIHNFRPGVMDRIGLDYDTVRMLNPRIVYGTVTGYGTTGPWRGKPGQDLLAQSLSGLAWLSGNAEDSPVPIGLPILDVAAGSNLVQGILAALVRRGVTGSGGRIEVDLISTALDLQFEPLTAYFNDPNGVPSRSAVSNANVYSTAPYGIYATANGYLALAMTPLKVLEDLLGLPSLSAFKQEETYQRRDEIKAEIADHLKSRNTQDWLSILEPADVWCSEVLSWEQLEQTEGFAALDPVQMISSDSGAQAKTTRCPIKLDGQILKSPVGAPKLGAHTNDYLKASATV